jgi:hypothetical protein
MLRVDRAGRAVGAVVIAEDAGTEVAPVVLVVLPVVVPVVVMVGPGDDAVEDSAVGCGPPAPQAAKP